jgi:molecular chaperone HtpG
MSEEKLVFQAEVSRLLDIVANALYSEREIFLRELISNASDACDRLRYAAITQPGLLGEDSELGIELRADPQAGTLQIRDNGVGMNHDDLIENLGTIAHSGSAAFLAEAQSQAVQGDGKGGKSRSAKKAAKPDLNQIGQFGVGFYSAFMVAEEVTVESRKAGEQQGWRWRSDGKTGFSVTESENPPARGTVVTLKLRKDAREFLDRERLERVVRAYSDHIAFPIVLLGEDDKREAVNEASALWTRAKLEISDEQYREFYRHVAHAFDEPWLRLHFKAEGLVEYTGLLFVPSARPLDLFHPDRKQRIKLYVKRVFITDECEELVPPYLRFLQGVIDSEDLPLNVSRELLQHNPVLTKIRNGIVKRVLSELRKRADKDPEGYQSFWSNFGAVLKEGLYEDDSQRELLLELARFRSTAGEGWVSLEEVVKRMPAGQDAIYFISGDELESLQRSPQLEGFQAKGIEVLLMTDPVDEFWIAAVGSYGDKPFRSVTRGSADLDKFAEAEPASDADKEGQAEAEQAEPPEGLDALVAFMRLALKDEVKDVRPSKRLTTSPVCLVAEEGDLDMHLERILRQHRQLDRRIPRVLEINPRHALIRRLAARIGEDAKGGGGELENAAHLLLDQARILEGESLPDPGAFTRRLTEMIERGLA